MVGGEGDAEVWRAGGGGVGYRGRGVMALAFSTPPLGYKPTCRSPNAELRPIQSMHYEVIALPPPSSHYLAGHLRTRSCLTPLTHFPHTFRTSSDPRFVHEMLEREFGVVHAGLRLRLVEELHRLFS